MLRAIKKIFRTLPLDSEEIRKLGGVVGSGFNNYGYIDKNHCHLLTVGDNVTIASGAKIEFHDASTKRIVGYSKFGCVNIGNNVFIGANSLVLPNVRIGDNVVVGAGSVVVNDIPENSVAVGNPCRVIKTYEEFVKSNKQLFKKSRKYSYDFNQMTNEQKEQQRQENECFFDL